MLARPSARSGRRLKHTVVYPEPFSPQSFRRHLQAELARRCADNPQYSLRAFARDLDVDHSSLSQILRGRRRLSERALRGFGERLGIAPDRIEAFVAHDSRRAAGEGSDGEGELAFVRELTEDALAVVTSLEHYAILELLRLEDFRPDVSWIARVLGITTDEVQVALQRLLRLGMLEMRAADRWVDLSGDVTTVLEGVAYEAIRRLSERVRSRALEAGLASSRAEREYSATTIAVDRADVPLALEKLARFRRDLVELLARGAAKDAVYQLEISFLPLTSPDRSERSGATDANDANDPNDPNDPND